MAWPRRCASSASTKLESASMSMPSIGSIWMATARLIWLLPPGRRVLRRDAARRCWREAPVVADGAADRSEEHTSELQSLMRISYAVFCLKKKNKENQNL